MHPLLKNVVILDSNGIPCQKLRLHTEITFQSLLIVFLPSSFIWKANVNKTKSLVFQ